MDHGRRQYMQSKDLSCALRRFAEHWQRRSNQTSLQDMNSEEDDDDEDYDPTLDDSHEDEDCVEETSGAIVDANNDLAVYYGIYKEAQISKGISVKDLKYDLDQRLKDTRTFVGFRQTILKELKKAVDSFIVANICAHRALNFVD